MSAIDRHVLIAANPKSGATSSQARVAGLRDALTEAGYICRVQTSLDMLQQECLSLDAAGQLRAIVSAGGDGTADALANRLPSHIPLLIFPLGTENLLAKHLGITGDIRQVRCMLQANQRLALDAGSANGKLFLVMLSCGFDAEVVRSMHAMRTGHINRWSYARHILSALRNYRFPQLAYQLVGDEARPAVQETLDRSAAWLFVFNVPRYAASLKFCPQADPLDGLLDICTFQRAGLGSGLCYLLRLWLGSHQHMRGFRHERCQSIQVLQPSDAGGRNMEVPFQVDGDPGGVLPLNIEVVPGRISVLVPPS